MIAEGLPVFGTCAGLILLAHDVEGQQSHHLGTLPISVRRNGYGRQLGSFHISGFFTGIGHIPMRFIRAPFITSCGSGVRPLAYHEGRIIAAESDTCPRYRLPSRADRGSWHTPLFSEKSRLHPLKSY